MEKLENIAKTLSVTLPENLEEILIESFSEYVDSSHLFDGVEYNFTDLSTTFALTRDHGISSQKRNLSEEIIEEIRRCQTDRKAMDIRLQKKGMKFSDTEKLDLHCYCLIETLYKIRSILNEALLKEGSINHSSFFSLKQGRAGGLFWKILNIFDNLKTWETLILREQQKIAFFEQNENGEESGKTDFASKEELILAKVDFYLRSKEKEKGIKVLKKNLEDILDPDLNRIEKKLIGDLNKYVNNSKRYDQMQFKYVDATTYFTIFRNPTVSVQKRNLAEKVIKFIRRCEVERILVTSKLLKTEPLEISQELKTESSEGSESSKIELPEAIQILKTKQAKSSRLLFSLYFLMGSIAKIKDLLFESLKVEYKINHPDYFFWKHTRSSGLYRDMEGCLDQLTAAHKKLSIEYEKASEKCKKLQLQERSLNKSSEKNNVLEDQTQSSTLRDACHQFYGLHM